MLTEFLMRTGLWVISLMFGGMGIFHLVMSFQDNPSAAIYALLFLSLATAMTFALRNPAQGSDRLKR